MYLSENITKNLLYWINELESYHTNHYARNKLIFMIEKLAYLNEFLLKGVSFFRHEYVRL